MPTVPRTMPAPRIGFTLSRSVKSAITPPIPKAQAWATGYLPTPSHPLLNLSQGVPGDPPHPALREALAEASADPRSAGYGPILGEEGLRRAVRGEMGYVYRWEPEPEGEAEGEGEGQGIAVGEEGTVEHTSNPPPPGLPPTWKEIAITAGCNQAFFNTMLALCDRGDKVIIPVPWYFNMLMTFQILGIEPLPLPLDPEAGFTPSPSTARAILQSPAGRGTKALVLVTPNNPTGATYPPALIEEFADLARDAGVALIIDETYRDFVRPESTTSEGPGIPHHLFQRPDWRSHVVSLASFSKSYKIPGHRLGAVVASQEVLEAITTVADCIQICAPKPPQLALTPLLPTLRADLSTTSARLHARLAVFARLVEGVRGWKVAAQGGFFSYVRHPYVLPEGGAVPSERVSEVLAMQGGVITLPGSFFMPERGTAPWRTLEDLHSPLVEDRWIRFAVANVSDEVVRRVPERLERLNGIMEREYGCLIED